MTVVDRDQSLFDRLANLFQISHNGRDATPQPLTQSDLIDIEEKFDEDQRNKRTDSLWDTLVEEVTRKKFPTFVDTAVDPSVYYKVPDMDDITAEVLMITP